MNLIEYIEKESGMNCPEWLRETIERYFAERTSETVQNVPNDDSISRQDAIEFIHKTIYGFFDIASDDSEEPISDKDVLLLEVNKVICNGIKGLPSAQPEIIRCKECKHAHMTYNGLCKYCDMRTDDYGRLLKLYLDGDFYCGDAERREDG